MILLECLLYAQGTDYQSCKSYFQADSLILLAEIVIGLRTGEQARNPRIETLEQEAFQLQGKRNHSKRGKTKVFKSNPAGPAV